MKAEDFLTAPSAEDFLTGADGSGEMTIPVKRRRGTEKARYVAPDNPDNPIAPAGLVAESIRMPAPTFDEERKGRTAVDALIAKTPAPAPRGPRPQRDIKAVAQDLYSILGNTGVQLVKPFVDIPNMMTGGALDEASRFLNNAGQAANLAASPTTNYDRETLGLMPEGASIDKVAQLITHPGLAANMGVPSAASMVMPLAATKAMGVLFPKAAAAMGEGFQTGAAVGSNALMNAGDTFGQTQADTGGRLLAALGSGVNSALVGKATGGGLEGQLARGKIPTWGAALKGIGNESLQEGGENFGNQLAQDTGEGKPLNFGAALDQAAIGATLAPFVSGPINVAGVATSPERRNARLLSDALGPIVGPSDAVDRYAYGGSAADQTAPIVPVSPTLDPSLIRGGMVRFDPVSAAEAFRQSQQAAPAQAQQLGYDPTVQNQIPAVAVDSQGNARPMSAEEFLAADTQRQEQQDMGLTPDVQKAIAARNVAPASETAPDVPSDLVKRLIDSGWAPPEKQAPASEGNNPNPDPASAETPNNQGENAQTGANDVQMRPAQRAEQEVLRALPRDLHAGVAENPPIDGRGAQENERSQLRERLPTQGQVDPEAVRSVPEPTSAEAPRGLQQAADSEVAVPPVPPERTPATPPIVPRGTSSVDTGVSPKAEPEASGTAAPPAAAPEKTEVSEAKGQGGKLSRPADKSESIAGVLDGWDAAGIKHSAFERDGTITVSRVVVPADQRGQGAGTKAMQDLIAYADRTGQRIVLSPSTDFGGNKNRLVDFYKRFGFVANSGRAKDFTISESMYRPAGGKLSVSESAGTSTPDTIRPPKSPEVASLVELRKRESILKKLRGCLA